MAKKRNNNARSGNILFETSEDVIEQIADHSSDAPFVEIEQENNLLRRFGRGERIAALGIGLLLVIGALGASGFGEKILTAFNLSNSGNRTNQPASARNSSTLARLNPFSAVVTAATPQLTKEYIYAGSRMLAIEDVNAAVDPPADLAVWRPSNGNWYVLGGTGSQQVTVQWGGSDDIPVPGDYDGDGKTDFGVYRKTTYTWYFNNSGGSTAGFPLGAQYDIPAPADFDGDGKTDAAVYRPSTGIFYIVRSSDQVATSISTGITNGTPAPADFDGDGKADATVWNSGSATYQVLKSTTNTTQTQTVGQSGDTPVPADYDGDGKADFAVRHGADWIIKQSSLNGQTQTVTWQLAGDRAVPNDYDGDGKVDIAVWRDSNGTWYIRNSTNPTRPRTVQWGTTNDIPVPAFYHRP